jgi:hypothetical protein
MTVRANKPEFNIREKLKSLDYAQVPYEKMPAGSVIQYVTKAYHSTSGTTNTTMTASGKKITIYPKYASSQIIVKFFATQFVDGNAGTRQTIRRNGSDFVRVFNEDGASASGVYTSTSQIGFYGSGNNGWYGMGVMMAVDVDHNTQGEALEYEVYLQAASGGNVYFPPGSVDHTFIEAYEVKR